MATVPGIDVSYWDAGIDWPKVRAAGQRFVFAKATEGDFYSDPTFDDNFLGSKPAGFLRGAYHFFRCNVDAKKQADYNASLAEARKAFADHIAQEISDSHAFAEVARAPGAAKAPPPLARAKSPT